MSSGGFHTVFDVSTAGWRYWWFPAIGLIYVGVGLALNLMIRTGAFRPLPPLIERWFPRVWLSFAILWTSVAFFLTFADYRSSISAMKHNRAKIVEGPVTSFHPMPYSGHDYESFVVNGVGFKYSEAVTSGFNNTASHGGPIHEGLMVRIWHYKGKILRLDIKEEPNKPHAANSRHAGYWRVESLCMAAVADADRWASR